MRNNQPASQQFFMSPSFTFQKDPNLFLSPVFNPFRKQSLIEEDLFDFHLQNQEIDDEKEDNLDKDSICRDIRQENCQEAGSPIHSHRCEAPSTRLIAARQDSEVSPLILVPGGDTANIQDMIQFLVEHSKLSDHLLESEGRRFGQKTSLLRRIYMILIPKFKKLKKTKEEMTKYCMRKAFKYIGQRWKNEGQQSADLDRCMKEYFAENDSINFSIPFKKHSSEKTMNAAFLKRVFSSSKFKSDYEMFITSIHQIVTEDNKKKISYLSNLIEAAISTNDISSIEKIRRIPWTVSVLEQVTKLAISLGETNNDKNEERSMKTKIHE